MKCLFSTALRLSYMQVLLAFKASCYVVLSSQCRNPRPESSVRAQSSHSQGKTSTIVIILLFVGHLPTAMGFDYAAFMHFLHVSCGSFLSLCAEIFSASLHVVLINSCSVNSSNFGVPLGGDKFKVFLAVLATPAQFFFFLMLWDIHSGDHHHLFISELFTECSHVTKLI